MNSITFTLQGEIVGVKRFKGNIDGSDIDQCKVLVLTPMDASSGNAIGSSVSEYRFGGSDNFERFKDFSFPFLADLFIEMTTNGKTQKIEFVKF